MTLFRVAPISPGGDRSDDEGWRMLTPQSDDDENFDLLADTNSILENIDGGFLNDNLI